MTVVFVGLVLTACVLGIIVLFPIPFALALVLRTVALALTATALGVLIAQYGLW
jgi:hypothetical protein